jgi:hypothetical protein
MFLKDFLITRMNCNQPNSVEHNNSEAKVKSDPDKSIVHSSGNDEFDWHHALQFHIDGSLQSSSLHDLREQSMHQYK